MKPIHSIVLYGLILLLATGFTVASLGFIRPAVCQRFCDAPEQVPCPSGACRAGEQRAGLPLPVLIDDPGGGSPTGGWGILGPEDLPNPAMFLVDVLFYAVVLWLIYYIGRILWKKEKHPDPLMLVAPLVLVLICTLLGLYLYWIV